MMRLTKERTMYLVHGREWCTWLGQDGDHVPGPCERMVYLELEDIDQGEDGIHDWVRSRTMYLDHEYVVHGRGWCT